MKALSFASEEYACSFEKVADQLYEQHSKLFDNTKCLRLRAHAGFPAAEIAYTSIYRSLAQMLKAVTEIRDAADVIRRSSCRACGHFQMDHCASCGCCTFNVSLHREGCELL